MASSESANCQVVLTLAHLLQQHSLSYDTEKSALLHTSVRCASHLASGGSGEVHIILTGSPRPTFAETNAWLLEGSGNNNTNNRAASPKKNNSSVNDVEMRETEDDRPAHLKGSYSIADNIRYSSSGNIDSSNQENEDMQDEESKSKLLQEYINEFTNSKEGESSTSGSSGHNTSFIRRNTTGVTPAKNAKDDSNDTRRRSTIDAGESSVNNNAGPMVGQAVVNAISQSSGVGLQSERSKLLQGTIDRPLWSQNRWTDGECLFSELVELCGMESFEKEGGTAQQRRQQQSQGGPDDAAGGAALPPSTAGTAPPNMSANLITVPATTLREPNAGVSQTTIDEIARGILRTVKRKKSPPASKVYIVLPSSNQGVDDEKRRLVVTFLKQAWEKLEQYNHMIGQPNLMSDAELEFVSV